MTWSASEQVNLLADGQYLRLYQVRRGPNGTIHLLLGGYGTLEGGGSGLAYRNWTPDAGLGPMTVATSIEETYGFSMPTDLAVDDTGRATVVWQRPNGGLEIIQQEEGSSEFLPPAPLEVAAGQTATAVAASFEGDRLHVAWVTNHNKVSHTQLAR